MAPAHRELRTWLRTGHSAITRIELSPVAQGKQRSGANQRSQWKGRVSWAHGQILLVKATQPQSSPVPPTLTASLNEQPEPEGHSPAAPDGHLSHARGWWGRGLEGRGEMPLGFAINHLFSPLTNLSVSGLIRLIFVPLFALKMTPPFPEIISPREMDANPMLSLNKGLGCPKLEVLLPHAAGQMVTQTPELPKGFLWDGVSW